VNPEFPPLPFEAINVLPRKPIKPPFFSQPFSAEARIAAARRARQIVGELKSQIRSLTPEQRRAIFLKMEHDRPITKKDLEKTGLTFFNTPGENESLLIPRKQDALEFRDLSERLDRLEHDPKSDKSLAFATNMTNLTVADPKDRLCTNFKKAYVRMIARRTIFVYEIEISSFAPHPVTKKKAIATSLSSLKTFLMSGAVYEHDDNQINEGVVRVVISSNGEQFRQLVENLEWRNIVTYFDERPKFETFNQRYNSFNIADTTILPPGASAPKICVIDSGVAAGNPFLAPVIDRELSKSFIGNFSPIEDAYGHGSGVASLAAYHVIDISAGGRHEAVANIISARITNDDGTMDVVEAQEDGTYRLIEAHLLSTTLEKVIAHYAPLDVKLFVLSYNILGSFWSKANHFSIGKRAWVARTLDRLVKKFDVLFIGITGNIDALELADLHNSQPYPTYFANPLAKILDPAQASLAVIVGSISHSATVINARATAIAPEGRPSPFTRSGPGFGNAIKPDFVERGGNSVYETETRQVRDDMGTNVVMASGSLSQVIHRDKGTSFAAPRIAHHAARIITDLQREFGVMPSANLLRALLAASTSMPMDDSTCKSTALAVCGHGLPNGKAATDCSQSSVLMFAQGTCKPDNVLFFPVNVPASLSQYGNGRKIIRVAIATAPSVQSWGTQNYTSVKTKFRLFRGDKPLDEIVTKMSIVDPEEDDGTISNPTAGDVEDLGSYWGITLRSVGTLQSDTFEWNLHREDYSTNPYFLAVTLQAVDWNRDAQIPLAVVVRIEDTTGRCNTLYTEVRAAVQMQMQALARART